MNKQAQREAEAAPEAAARPAGEAPRAAGQAGALDPAAALRLRWGPAEREVVLKLIAGLKAL